MPLPSSRSTASRRRQKKILVGILVPRRWETSGEVTSLALNTLDEREYVIDDPGCSTRGLLRYLRKRVRLDGAVIGDRVVRVAAVSVLNSLDTPQSSSAKGDEE